MSIPKIIHYCWFGGKPLPGLARKCIESWKKYCPDYEIKEWNESNFDLECCDYVKEAYHAGKWAFVSDYARFKILYEHGGIYFDTDVELIRTIDDILEEGSFMGIEACGKIKKANVASGLGMATFPASKFVAMVLDDYHQSHFIKDENGNYETVVIRITRLLSKYGKIRTDQITNIMGINIYPADYFCPLNWYTGKMQITDNTRAIHHYDGSWVNEERRRRNRLKYQLIKFLPELWADKIAVAIVVLQMQGIKNLFLRICEYIKTKVWGK